jgi:uncharacterized protein (TIGR03118 family)
MIHRLGLIITSLAIVAGTAQAGVYVQTNLVSDGSVPNTVTDANLLGAWGLSYSTTSPFWISDQAANINVGGTQMAATTVYRITTPANAALPPTSSGPLLTVGIQGTMPPNTLQTEGPTGQVNTSAPGVTTGSGDFVVGTSKAAFIFANLDGTLSGWNGGAHSTIEPPVTGASFTGLAIANLPNGGAAQLYAADQNSANVDVFNTKWQMVGTITDPHGLPSGYAPFNVQMLNVNGTPTLFVTFANQSTTGGIVDEFKTDGTFIKTLVSDTAGTHLAAPWGVTIAPAGWGQFGGDVLVANNNPNNLGLTEINAYSLDGTWQGTLTLKNGQPFSVDELWAISFGNGAGAGSKDTLFFTAGLADNTGGLFGAIQSIPEPSPAILGLIAVGVVAGGYRFSSRRRRTAKG